MLFRILVSWRKRHHENQDGNEHDESPYDARLVEVTAALAEVERPGDYFTCGSFPLFSLPGLTIEGLGEVALPLQDHDAKVLISKYHLAPYGQGEDTIVDTHVRNTWELHADEFQLANAKWTSVIDKMVDAMRVPLGISETTVFEAQLYKLLLYEESGKFAKHQDSEKEVGMFGTLVVMLPCRFRGGELWVHHPSTAAGQCQPHVWDPASMNLYDLKYAAFYGGCEHEVKPVTSGYRLCLTYNLVTRSTTQVPRFAGNHALFMPLETALGHFLGGLYRESRRSGVETTTTQSRDCQLVYVLEHKYTNPGLSFAYLKNKDHVIAQSLAKYCTDHHGVFSLFLCNIKYIYEYDPDNDEEEYADKSVQLKGAWIKYGEQMTIPGEQKSANLETEIAPAGFFEDVPWDRYENHGFTGNAGSRAEKWYTSAALVVQPMKIELEQTVRAGMDYAVNKWIKMVDAESVHADFFAATLFSQQRQWSTSDLCFLPCLKSCTTTEQTRCFRECAPQSL